MESNTEGGFNHGGNINFQLVLAGTSFYMDRFRGGSRGEGEHVRTKGM